MIIRSLRITDVTPEYIDALNDPSVNRFTEARHTKWTENNVIRFVLDSKPYIFGIFIADTKHIGNIRLSNPSEIHKRIDLGIMIFNKSYWNRGIGTQALLKIEKYIFNTLNYEKICADYYSCNRASARMFEKAGYRREGIFLRHFKLDGEYVSSIRIAKFKQEPRT